jgi:DNA-binding CsgD family transcriptional regulator
MTDPAQPRTPTGAPLTLQQLRCAAHAAQGLSNAEIGEEMGLTGLTVKSHMGRALVTAGALNRAHLVAILIRNRQLEFRGGLYPLPAIVPPSRAGAA